MTAVWSRDTGVVRRLLEAGAWINAQTDKGQTALMDAAHTRNREMAELLLDAGANVTIRDDLGRNAAARLPDGGGPDMERAPREARAGGGSVGEMSEEIRSPSYLLETRVPSPESRVR